MTREDARSKDVSREEMERRTAHFKDLVPYKVHLQRDSNIPSEVIEKIAAQTVYPVMIPRGYKGRHAGAPIKDGNPGLVVAMVESPPGDGAVLHIHEQAVENFFCVSGQFEITWGDHGENSLTLNPLDFCSVPRGVMRAFKNVSKETGRMLAILHNETPEQEDRTTHSPELRKKLEAEHGSDVFKSLEQIGLRFDAQLKDRA
jgi:uncharacterized RmlC-like cupin family protein